MGTISNRGNDSLVSGGVSQNYSHEYDVDVGIPTEIPFTLAAAGAATIIWQSAGMPNGYLTAWNMAKLFADPSGLNSTTLKIQVGIRVGALAADSGTELWFTLDRTEPLKFASQAAALASDSSDLASFINRISVRNANAADAVSGLLVLFPPA